MQVLRQFNAILLKLASWSVMATIGAICRCGSL